MSRKSTLITAGVAVASAGISAGITWVLTKRVLEQQYEERIQEEIKISLRYILAQQGVKNVIVSDEDPDILAEQLNEEADKEPIDLEVVEVKTEDPVIGERVFADEKPPLEDLAARNQATRYDKVMTPDIPDEVFPEQPEIPDFSEENPDIVIISRDIFMANPQEWQQDVLTYFQDDGVLDESMTLVEDHEDLIGKGRPRFGELSGDANVVYVRNTKLEREFEILADPGNASEFLAHSLGELYKPSWAR